MGDLVSLSCGRRGIDDGHERHRPVSPAMGAGQERRAPMDDLGTDTPGAVVRHPTAGSRLDRLRRRSGAGTGPPHHRPVGRRPWPGRADSLDVRADRPPALDEAQKEELKAAVRQPPATSGIELPIGESKGVGYVHQAKEATDFPSSADRSAGPPPA